MIDDSLWLSTMNKTSPDFIRTRVYQGINIPLILNNYTLIFVSLTSSNIMVLQLPSSAGRVRRKCWAHSENNLVLPVKG